MSLELKRTLLAKHVVKRQKLGGTSAVQADQKEKLATLKAEVSQAIDYKFATLYAHLAEKDSVNIRIGNNDNICKRLTQITKSINEKSQAVLVSSSLDGYHKLLSIVELFKLKLLNDDKTTLGLPNEAKVGCLSSRHFHQYNKIDYVTVTSDYNQLLKGARSGVDAQSEKSMKQIQKELLCTIKKTFKLPLFLVVLRVGDGLTQDAALLERGWSYQNEELVI
ncbi:hypothetical protein BABINDRAFT_160812 [Babjeviella inositovora NRRL Y-12698]|uniref:DNA/RNA-binding protein Alba-like domain-containing protein n=1 Tax=Babjeviella inositovora NRRL Y-12698 TaxID=984486 RepID=A0A1E3QS82_9ASCO|nr:uncharacterized protein BABINDRAFT_160812 [Babjeviella inositovora NRRL Y-12698]ODQ80541.1 hypothetical protein BABINDRAFT_160812 [Babjeviella inositovora NRRL Y-12698]